MLVQFVTIGLLMLFAVMLPGPDVALVTKNTISHSRRAGIFTSLGISSANLVHLTYCALGLAVVIAHSVLLFDVIKYIGAAYLVYLGMGSLQSSTSKPHTHDVAAVKSSMSDRRAYLQGFLCNLLNPKATLFFLALFTTVVKPNTAPVIVVGYVVEMFFIIILWFCGLTLLLSHGKVVRVLDRAEKYIAKGLGVLLISFGIAMLFVRQ